MIESKQKIPSDATPEAVGRAVIEAMCRLLGDEDELRRCWAAQALGRIGASEAARALVAALEDEDEDVRSDAAEALAALAGPELGATLQESLVRDPCGAVKLAAIDGLARLRHAPAIPLLRALLRNRDAGVVWDEEGFVNEGWDDWLDVQARAIGALAEMGAEEAAADILAAMRDEEGQDLSEPGTRALARLGGPGLAALAELARDPDPRRRRRVMRAIAGADHEDARRLLLEGLRDRDPEVRLVALTALAEKDPQHPSLAGLFRDPAPEVRAEAVRRCGRFHGEHLDALFDDRSSEVQAAALEALLAAPRLTVPRLVRRLRVKLRGPDGPVAAKAAELLAVRAPDIAREDLAEQLADTDRPEPLRCAAIECLARLDPPPAPLLARYLRDPRRPVRITALSLLTGLAGREQSPVAGEARALLIGALGRGRGPEEEAPPQPEAEAEADGEGGPEGERSEGTETGTPTAEEPVSETPTTETKGDYPVSTLEAILGEPPPVIEQEARESVELTEEDLEFLALANRRPRKRRVAPEPEIAAEEEVPRLVARLLGDLSGDEVAVALASVLADPDRELAAAAADSLTRIAAREGRLPAEVGEALRAACAATDRDTRLAAVRALGDAGDIAAGEALRAALEDADPFVRAEALRSLGRRGEASRTCTAALTDPEPNVRLAAAEALLAGEGPAMVPELARRASSFEGYYRRRLGQLLRRADAAGAARCLLEDLETGAERSRCRAAIELAEELFRPEPASGERSGTGGLHI